jgi:fructuronate reductase/mannitol 2-dehydrogenase
VARELGVDDRWPVVSERFSQWIVEDDFCNGRPPLERVGVRFVPDVAPYKLMKTRLLNGSHSALGYLGYLAGHSRTDEAMADPRIAEYVTALMGREVAPLLPSVPGIDLDAYQRTLVERFANPRVADPLARLCGRGSTKVPSYVLPSIRAAREAGQPHGLLTLAVAGWLRYLRGVDESGRPIEVRDADAERLGPLAETAGRDPRPVLRECTIFGDLGRDPQFAAAVGRALAQIETRGVRGAIEMAMASEPARGHTPWRAETRGLELG